MSNTRQGPARGAAEVIIRSSMVPGADPVSVRIMRGQVTYSARGYGHSRDKTGGAAAAEALPPAVYPDSPNPTLLSMTCRLNQFSSVRLYLRFVDGNGDPVAVDNASTATVTAYRVNDNGDTVKTGEWTNLGHLDEKVDDNSLGRNTVFHIAAPNYAGGAAAVGLRVAGEGLGYSD